MNKRVTNSRVANICNLELCYCLTHSLSAHAKITLFFLACLCFIWTYLFVNVQKVKLLRNIDSERSQYYETPEKWRHNVTACANEFCGLW
jgi:hypothetical protein